MTVDSAQQYGRIRRLASRYCFGVETQTRRIKKSARAMRDREVLVEFNQIHCDLQNKNDWEALIVFLARLRKCLLLLGKCRPDLPLEKRFLKEFDRLLPHLVDLRDFEEHFDEYSTSSGRREEFKWGHLESYAYGDEKFASGVGSISVKSSKEAAQLAWKAVLSVEGEAKRAGWISWEDRIENNTPWEEVT